MLAAARKHEVWVLTNADTRSCGGGCYCGRRGSGPDPSRGIEFGMDERTFTRLTVPVSTGTTTAGSGEQRHARSSSNGTSASTWSTT